MDFNLKSVTLVALFNTITQAIPIGLAIYFGISLAVKRNKIVL